jgi:hypothetical protein
VPVCSWAKASAGIVTPTTAIIAMAASFDLLFMAILLVARFLLLPGDLLYGNKLNGMVVEWSIQ